MRRFETQAYPHSASARGGDRKYKAKFENSRQKFLQ